MLSFLPVSNFKRGDVFNILYRSYEQLLKEDIKNKDKYILNWKQTDINSFSNPQIGECTFITCSDDKQVGFFSYDPRHFPDYGIIGQNCILPEYRKQGYGKKQIEEVLKFFKKNNCKKAKVTTAGINYFLPARKMYESLGLNEVKRHFDKQWSYEIIEYDKTIK